MKILLYAGPAPWRDLVCEFSTQIIEHVVTSLTLVTGGGEDCRPWLVDAVKRLDIPAHVPVTLAVLPGSAQAAILTAARDQVYDLVIFGRFRQSLERFFLGTYSREIAQRLEPSVLRVHKPTGPIRRILLSSGGDHHTFDNVRMAAWLAAPLGASVTILHVRSQQSLFFEGLPGSGGATPDFLAGDTTEARILREAADYLQKNGVPACVEVRNGPVLDEILAEVHTEAYELLVIGGHKVASALDRILLENITDDLLDRCPLPVLVVKSAT